MPVNGAEASDDALKEACSDERTARVLKKGPWTAAEDAILMEYVKKHGEGNWNAVQKNSGLSRCGKSCRLRWANHLRPNLKKGSFTPEEERLILELHAKFGNKWARMATQLPGRTDNEIKNYWNTRVKRCQRAGLPLYPQDVQKQATTFDLHHHNLSCSSPSPPPLVQPAQLLQEPKPDFFPSFSFFDSTSYLTTNPTLGHHNSPFFSTPIQQFKRPRNNNNGFSLPILTPPIPPLPSTLFDHSLSTQLPSSLQFNSRNFNGNPQPIIQTPFEPDGLISRGSSFSMNMELPSSQFSQPATTTAVLGSTNEFTNVTPFDQSHSGLLDALLQETQTMVDGDQMKKEALLSVEEEKYRIAEWGGVVPPPGSVFSESTTTPPSGSASKWGGSSSSNSSIRVKTEKEHEEQINPLDDDFSNFLDIIPSTISVPDWYSDSQTINGPSALPALGTTCHGFTDNPF